MNKEHILFLQENLRSLGFGESMTSNEILEQEMEKGHKEFQLVTTSDFDEWSRMEATLSFRRAENDSKYFFTRYYASLLYHENPDFNRSQTFYISSGSGVSFKESFNLLQGRAVNKNLTNLDGEKYNAWIQLDFNERTANHNYKVRQFRAQHGYDLEKILHNYPIRELAPEELKLNLIASLKRGNLHPVTFVKKDKPEKMYIAACPQYKTITILSQAVRVAQMLAFQNIKNN